jgi:hypothetical protein
MEKERWFQGRKQYFLERQCMHCLPDSTRQRRENNE